MIERDLRGLRTFVRLMDDAIPIPGTSFRIGLDPIIGLIPGAGDLAGGLLSTMVVLTAARAGAPRSILLRMVANAGIDVIVGSIPLLGDVFDAGWKANRKNLDLLERYLERPVDTRRASLAFVIGAVLVILLLFAGSIAVTILLAKALLGWGTH